MGRIARQKRDKRAAKDEIDRHITGMWINLAGLQVKYDPAKHTSAFRDAVREQYLRANKFQGKITGIA